MKLRHALPGIPLAAVLLANPPWALGHCDTLDGPVVKDARTALEARDVSPLLKWVTAAREAEVRKAFRSAIAVRELGAEARSLADRFLFETLVRIHREGEGAPYTGLKPAGTAIDPAVLACDKALDTGSLGPLVGMITAHAEQGLRERFVRATEAKRRAGDSAESGRLFVAAYVEFVHYAERLLHVATTDAGHGAAGAHAAPAGDGH